MSTLSLGDAFRQGDAQAFPALFLEHYGALYHYGVKLVDDSMQELFQKLWEPAYPAASTS